MIKINPLNTGKAIAVFVVNSVITYCIWQVVPTIMNIMDGLGLWTEWETSGIKPIIWFGLGILALIWMLGIPMWILFEEE